MNKKQLKEIEEALLNPPESVVKDYLEQVEKLKERLPVATSAEVLNQRMDW